MAGFDKHMMMEKLKARGWIEDKEYHEHWQMIPPESLFENRPANFYVYDAETLQNLLGELVERDE